jgi:hypothetical protein
MDGPWGALCISVYSLKRGRSQLTEEDIVRPTALMADTRLTGVSIGGTTATYAPSACGGRGLLRQRKDFHLAYSLPLQGRGIVRCYRSRPPQGEAPTPGRSPFRAKARLRRTISGVGLLRLNHITYL